MLKYRLAITYLHSASGLTEADLLALTDDNDNNNNSSSIIPTLAIGIVALVGVVFFAQVPVGQEISPGIRRPARPSSKQLMWET